MEFKAATDRMRAAAECWRRSAYSLGEAAGRTGGVEMTEVDAGIFASTLPKYEPVPAYVHDRLTEGIAACQRIAEILMHCAQTYEDEDTSRAQQINATN